MTGRKKVASAEQSFREAFERLKVGRPINVTKGKRVSQNVVAMEAGCDPSALKKARFPQLVQEIQTWLARDSDKKPSVSRRELVRSHRRQLSKMREELERVKAQRDSALATLVEADTLILSLTHELKGRKESKKVVPFRRARGGVRSR